MVLHTCRLNVVVSGNSVYTIPLLSECCHGSPALFVTITWRNYYSSLNSCSLETAFTVCSQFALCSRL